LGVDAAIVQDVGICRLIRHLSPDFPIHASTQMTVTSAAGVEFAHELGCDTKPYPANLSSAMETAFSIEVENHTSI
jgi:collagenase-like PrtC family protease